MVKFEDVIGSLDEEAMKKIPRDLDTSTNMPDLYFRMAENYLAKAKVARAQTNFEDVYLNLRKYINLINNLSEHPDISQPDYIDEYSFNNRKKKVFGKELERMKYEISKIYEGDYPKPAGYVDFEERQKIEDEKEKKRREEEEETQESPGAYDSPIDFEIVKREDVPRRKEERIKPKSKKEEGGVLSYLSSVWSKVSNLKLDISNAPDDL